MKKILPLFLFSIISIQISAQTVEELDAQILLLQQENQSLTLQSANYDTKIKEREKEQSEAEENYKKLQTKLTQAEEACKSISESDLKLIQGLSAGTIAMSGVETVAGTAMLVTSANTSKNANTNSDKEQENMENIEETPTLQKASTANKIYNIGATALSAGSTITSAVALSKVNGLKNDIKKCVESFN